MRMATACQVRLQARQPPEPRSASHLVDQFLQWLWQFDSRNRRTQKLFFANRSGNPNRIAKHLDDIFWCTASINVCSKAGDQFAGHFESCAAPKPRAADS